MKTNPNDKVNGSNWSCDSCKIGSQGFGLTKREYFAAMAMQGALANSHFSTGSVDDGESFNQYKEGLVRGSVKFADALIAELNKEKV